MSASKLYSISLENPAITDADWMPKYATLFVAFTAGVGVPTQFIPANDAYNGLFLRLYNVGDPDTAAYVRIMYFFDIESKNSLLIHPIFP